MQARIVAVEIESTIDVAASSDDVWRVMIDVERWPEWTPTIGRLERLDVGPFQVGSRVRIHQPRLPKAIWTVTALEDGHAFEWQNTMPGVRSVAGHRVERRESGGARVTLTLRWTGPLAPLLRLLYGRLARRYVQTEASSLKRRCEAGGG